MSSLIEKIDKILPQTQCGLCSYGACLPYAKAIAENNEEINRCPPGGLKTLLALAQLLNRDASPFLEEMKLKAKPPSRAVIREDECIGCTKCIQACPVDAIIGSSKRMHTVIASECTGCELCVSPCPVDCIDMMIIDDRSEEELKKKTDLARKRYRDRQKRLEGEIAMTKHSSKMKKIAPDSDLVAMRKAAIQEAIARNKHKRKQNGCQENS